MQLDAKRQVVTGLPTKGDKSMGKAISQLKKRTIRFDRDHDLNWQELHFTPSGKNSLVRIAKLPDF